MDRDTRLAAQRCLDAGAAAVVIEVCDAQGSAPRGAGTRMLVTPQAAFGTVGGGHLELKAIATAREMLRTGELAPRREHYPLGPALGQCCGGAVTLSSSRLDADALSRWPVPAPLFHLQLYGAGHVGRAIATLLATLDVVVDWIDERDEEFPADTVFGTPWPAHIRSVCVDAVEAEVSGAPAGAFYLVLTHRHDLDLRIAEAILRRGDFGFLGLIGSKTKRQRFAHRFEERGLAPALVARMVCPIGVEGITGKQPEVIAAAVVAQLLQRP
ncbi:xanthine dehydrogenase accessory protein XdhC [Piscinibacter sp.]|uniref:xanthine dehydrogenase accessory protein XdhC n=1 Tax=Piscinibacter sp. TaxID=1903157 RepID=UPI002B8DB1D3|nr:xanthine dehydrogenase accessory protein XdhC [Albitalea sp.]HUG23869.1 xanthine dehydrogenase accessory protein XdhC [Albitalea sp.]